LGHKRIKNGKNEISLILSHFLEILQHREKLLNLAYKQQHLRYQILEHCMRLYPVTFLSGFLLRDLFSQSGHGFLLHKKAKRAEGKQE